MTDDLFFACCCGLPECEPCLANAEIERMRAEVDRLTGEKEELRALISSCDSGQTALTCHLKLRLIRDAMRAVCTQRRDCMAIDHDYPCPMGGRP